MAKGRTTVAALFLISLVVVAAERPIKPDETCNSAKDDAAKQAAAMDVSAANKHAVAAAKYMKEAAAAKSLAKAEAAKHAAAMDVSAANKHAVAAAKYMKEAAAAKAEVAKHAAAMSLASPIGYVAAAKEAGESTKEATSRADSPSRKKAAATLAAAHFAAYEKSAKEAEAASTPAQAEAARQDAAKSAVEALKYGAIAQQASSTA